MAIEREKVTTKDHIAAARAIRRRLAGLNVGEKEIKTAKHLGREKWSISENVGRESG